MNGKTDDHSSSGEAGADRPDADADESDLVRAPSQAPNPPWLRPSDVDVLAKQFAPLNAAHVRHLALALAEGSTPVEILIQRLVAAGLAPTAARWFIAELRVLRERTRRQAMPGASTPASEVAAALNAAATSYLLKAGDDEQAARAIMRQVGWSIVRARWFVSVNRDEVRRLADRLSAERPADG
jgi:hypothetical protein